MTTSKNKGSGAISDKEKPPLPTPTTARKQVQRKYYIMRGVSFQALRNTKGKGDFMPSVIEELYCSSIRSESKSFSRNVPLVESAKLEQINREKLIALLSEEGKEIFEKFCDAKNEVEDITRYNTFRYALKFGILLMTEVFSGMDEVTGCHIG